MSHQVRTFRAATAEDALAQMRRELGVDAVVVEVKQVAAGGLFGWLSSRQTFEVTATPAAQTPRQTKVTTQTRQQGPTTQGTIAAAAAKLSTKSESNGQANTKNENSLKGPMPSSTRSMSEGLAPPPPLLAEPSHQLKRAELEGGPYTSRLETPQQLIADIVRNLPTKDSGAVAFRVTESFNSPRHSPAKATSESTPTIEQRLDALAQMIAELGQRSRHQVAGEIPSHLFPHYLTLIESDVDEAIARELIQQLHRHAPAKVTAADQSSSISALLTALIEQRIPCDRGIVPTSGQRQIVMVVGPTGVGKTTTLAKLAGRFGVEEGCRIGLITVDTYRVAAVEQLKTYAEIIDLPMRIVGSPAEMQEALDSFANYDLVLIDTAGRSPNDDRKLAELKQLIDAACPDHIYLVLSLASGAGALRAAADRFAAIQPTSLVFTKLDEATGCGGLLSASRDIGLPISYFTTGQEVPRDIEPANPCRAARLIVGTDSLEKSIL